MNLNFKYAMFDMDGTIIDSMKYWRYSVLEYAKKQNFVCDKEFEENLKDMSCLAGINYLKSVFAGTPLADVSIDALFDIMIEHYIYDIGYKDGAVELLEFLHKKGVKLCLISASPLRIVSIAAKKLGFGKYFDFMMTCEEFPSGNKDEEAFTIAMNRLAGGDVSDEIVVFEDAYYAVATLNEMKIRCAAIKDEFQTHNLDYIKQNADWYFVSPRAALEYFSKE